MNKKAIVANQLTYQYGERIAVDQVSFSVEKGEILGFLGPNGAGKSTTVKMLTGQIPPKKGEALLLGENITHNGQKIRAKIGVCFETTNLYEQMSAVENLNLFAQLFGIKQFDANTLLEKVGLSGRGHERVSSYSKGMKQRLMIARALVNNPEILFLDEPTDGLDPVSSQAIRTIIKQESEKGTAVFLTTHDMTEADKLSHRVAFINDGNIVALDTPTQLKRAYGKRALKLEIKNGDGKISQKEILLDQPETTLALTEALSNEDIISVHSSEATLEDIFIRITGRGL